MNPAVLPDPAPLLALGFVVFGIPAGTKERRRGWHAGLIDNPDELADRWLVGDNIGVACRPSRLVVLDLDIKEGVHGRDVLAHAAARARRPWPDTFTVNTPSGGCHLYFQAPAGEVPSTSGGVTRLGPAIDVRAPGRTRGGYVLGPGSVIGGRCYCICDDRPVQPLPAWITTALTNRKSG